MLRKLQVATGHRVPLHAFLPRPTIAGVMELVRTRHCTVQDDDGTQRAGASASHGSLLPAQAHMQHRRARAAALNLRPAPLASNHARVACRTRYHRVSELSSNALGAGPTPHH